MKPQVKNGRSGPERAPTRKPKRAPVRRGGGGRVPGGARGGLTDSARGGVKGVAPGRAEGARGPKDGGAPRSSSEQDRRIDRLASLGELAAGVAHEIRNPLAGIGTCAQVLRSRFSRDDERVKFADVILDEVARLEKIIENLLMFARPKQPQLVRHDMRDSVERTLSLVREQAEKQNVAVETRCQALLPAVYVDPGQMSQVLLNLVLNGIQAMPDGGRLTLELTTARKNIPASGGRRKTDVQPVSGTRTVEFVRLTVSDTGAGISKENVAKLFTPFFTTKSNGTGLGLSISQAILREHGGSISVSSTQGEGTRVIVDIPVEKRYGERR